MIIGDTEQRSNHSDLWHLIKWSPPPLDYVVLSIVELIAVNYLEVCIIVCVMSPSRVGDFS